MQTLAALADPTRLRIVEMLAQGERSSGEIARKFKISGPAISQHLRVLRNARLIMTRIEGQRRIQALDPRGLDEVEAWVSRMRQIWNARLDTLERLLLEEDAKLKTKKK